MLKKTLLISFILITVILCSNAHAGWVAWIEGFVVDLRTRKGIKGAEVWVETFNDQYYYAGSTIDSSGYYFVPVQAGMYNVTIRYQKDCYSDGWKSIDHIENLLLYNLGRTYLVNQCACQ